MLVFHLLGAIAELERALMRERTAARHEQDFLLAKSNPPRPGKILPDVLPWKYTGNQLHRLRRSAFEGW